MTRTEVYEAISTERNFQNYMTAREDRPDMIEDMHVGDILTAIRVNLNKAENFWYAGAVPHQDCMQFLRKIAALCVKAGEMYGMPERLMVKN